MAPEADRPASRNRDRPNAAAHLEL